MTKYIFVLMLMCGLVIAQNSGDPNGSLDRPLGATLAKVRVVGGYFNTWSIQGIIKTLVTMQNGPSNTNVWSHYWVGDTGAEAGHQYDSVNLLKEELLAFYNNFPQGSEVFRATLNNGETGYVDTYGYHLDNTSLDENGQTIDNTANYDTVMGGLPSHTYTLNFYGGRNTAAGPDLSHATSEVVINTSSGNEYRIYAYDTTTPLVLDMDGDDRLEASHGEWLPHPLSPKSKLLDFDINGDGFDECIEWVGPNDGLLLTYTPGQKVNGKNLFGFAQGFTDGFEQLSTLDANQDNKITGEELNTLSVWQDKNSNARADSGEVMSVKELGITEIGVRHANLVSSFVQNGKNRVMWDWHPVMFMVKKNHK